MTSVDGTTPEGDAAGSAMVAESLSTVGYAMFALLNTGPLETVPSMSEFMERLRAEEAAAVAAAAAEQSDTFGVPGVGEDMGAIRNPSKPLPVTATSFAVPGPPQHGAPVEAPAAQDDTPAEGDEQTTAYPQPKNPIGSIPEYTGNHTLKMLDEISFLDE